AGRKHPSTGSDNKPSPHPKQPCRPPQTPGPCWFCLASPEVESIWWSTLARIATLPWPKEAYLMTVSSFCPLDTTIQWKSFGRGGGRGRSCAISQDTTDDIRNAFIPRAQERQIHSAVKQMAEPGAAAYFYVVFDSGEKLFHRIKGIFLCSLGERSWPVKPSLIFLTSLTEGSVGAARKRKRA
ncbi:hypothetical protein EI555_003016, partial [Monodon monoceros]